MIYAVYENNHCLLQEPYRSHKYSVFQVQNFLILQYVLHANHTDTLGLKDIAHRSI